MKREWRNKETAWFDGTFNEGMFTGCSDTILAIAGISSMKGDSYV